MKLAFFLVAFYLILFRVYYKSIWPGVWTNGRVSITISNGDDYEQIRYMGKIRLTEDESGIASISPGGYIKYRHNDIRLTAEGDIQGHITYDIRNDGRRLTPADDGRNVIHEALGEMIAYGFDARGRMLRVYNRGGDSALQVEMARMKSSGIADMYRTFLASHQPANNDSLKKTP
jgi:hypothetical protein